MLRQWSGDSCAIPLPATSALGGGCGDHPGRRDPDGVEVPGVLALDQWQVDVEVYREAGVSVLTGRPIYSALTESPQLLPFTYPPFAALLAIPLALVPFGAAGWIWTGLQILATTAIVWYAGWRLIHGFGAWAPIALAVLTAPMLWLAPVADGLRFGQVNAFMVLACLMDLRNPRPLWLRRVPRGVLIGLAMAVKLTPGVFVIHLLVTRRWREASTAIGTAVLVTLGAFVVLPEASLTFWGGALQDPSRLGPNVGSSNQSLRGVLLRLLPDSTLGSVLWVILAGAVAIGGFWLARQRYLAHDSIGEVAVVGLLACLLSPVAWIHHHHWVVVVILRSSARSLPNIAPGPAGPPSWPPSIPSRFRGGAMLGSPIRTGLHGSAS